MIIRSALLQTVILRLALLIVASAFLAPANAQTQKTPDWIVKLHEDIQRQYSNTPSGVYRARSIKEIQDTHQLEGCQDWGTLWMEILTEKSIKCAYLQGVDMAWLTANPPETISSGWSGHVFIEAEIGGQLIVFDSTSASPAIIDKANGGFEVLDKKYVLLLRCNNPKEYRADTQEGIQKILVELSRRWHLFLFGMKQSEP
jgi:hypothetical protein